MSEEKKEGLGNWEYKRNEEKAKEVEEAFGEELVEVEVEEEEKMAEEKKEEVKEEKKEETQEEKKERYIDILVGIGFLKGKDKGDNKERFYYKINDNSAVGRTFDSRTPLGKFWAKINGEWLKDKECKEVEIIKRFYAIRGGEEEMPERHEEEKREEPANPVTGETQKETAEIMVREEAVVEVKPEQVIADAQRKADSLFNVVEKQHLYQPIHGKRYLTVEAWMILGKFCSLTAAVEWVKPVEMHDVKGFEARVVVTDVGGKVVSVAESMCMNDETNWKGKPIFQLKSMAQTRALSKAYRMCLSFIVTLAGYSPTPAEEMTE